MIIADTSHTVQVIMILSSGVLGAVIGSFLNVVIYRLPIMLKNRYQTECASYLNIKSAKRRSSFNLATPRSHCPQCKIKISWWQNMPIISYLLLKGKCSGCQSPISWHYPVVEMLAAMTTLLVFIKFGLDPKLVPVLILTWTLIVATFIDIKHQILPDDLTIPLIWLGLLLNVNYTFTSPHNAIIGASSGYIFLWLVAKVFKLIRKIDGMGHGDFKLLAVFGGWLGWQSLSFVLFAASAAGLLIGIPLVLCKKHRLNKPMPFGPFLAAAGWLVILSEPSVFGWYN